MTDLPFSFEFADGRECTIRPTAEDDAAEFCVFIPRVLTESDNLLMFPDEFRLTPEEEAAWLRERIERDDAIHLVALVDGRVVGVCGAEAPKFRRQAHLAELGMMVGKEFWGHGVGRRFMAILIEWGRSRGLRKLTLRVFDDNARAIRLYESFGFVEEGRLRGDVFRADGRYSDTIMMARRDDR